MSDLKPDTATQATLRRRLLAAGFAPESVDVIVAAAAADLVERGRNAAQVSWAKTKDRPARTAPARAAFEQRFLDLADGDPVRAAELRKEHFTRLGHKAAEARRRNREAQR